MFLLLLGAEHTQHYLLNTECWFIDKIHSVLRGYHVNFIFISNNKKVLEYR